MENFDINQFLDLTGITSGIDMGPLNIFISLSITFITVLFIFFVYKKTYSGVLYSKNFSTTLIMTSLIVNMIMIGIGSNIILSLGMVGALSIVRFRTAIKDPKDTAFIFWAISIGIVNGIAYYELSIIATLFIGVILLFTSQNRSINPSYVLILKYIGNINDQISLPLNKYCKSHHTRSDSREGDMTEKVIEVRLKDGVQENFINSVREIKGINKCLLLSSTGDIAE